jgi:putative sigma-54 modulation protein
VRLQVKGRNVDVSDSLFTHAERKLGKLAKHLSEGSRCELELAVENNPSIDSDQIAEATVWTKGPVLRARESSPDMYASIDQVADKLERQVKRYRERRSRRATGMQAAGQLAAPPAPTATLSEEEQAVIVKTKQFNMKPMGPEEAALQLELIGHDFFVFVNADSEDVNVIYKRRDGNYGLIEPVRSNGDQ